MLENELKASKKFSFIEKILTIINTTSLFTGQAWHCARHILSDLQTNLQGENLHLINEKSEAKSG